MADKDKFADEIMNDEELNGVAGGTDNETVLDSRFLYERGLMKECIDPDSMDLLWLSCTSEVAKAWDKVGIECNTLPDRSNIYLLNDKVVSRDEAWKYVSEKYPKIRDAK